MKHSKKVYGKLNWQGQFSSYIAMNKERNMIFYKDKWYDIGTKKDETFILTDLQEIPFEIKSYKTKSKGKSAKNINSSNGYCFN